MKALCRAITVISIVLAACLIAAWRIDNHLHEALGHIALSIGFWPYYARYLLIAANLACCLAVVHKSAKNRRGGYYLFFAAGGIIVSAGFVFMDALYMNKVFEAVMNI